MNIGPCLKEISACGKCLGKIAYAASIGHISRHFLFYVEWDIPVE